MQKHHDREWHNVKQNDRSLKITFLHESNRKDRFWQSIKFLGLQTVAYSDVGDNVLFLTL